MVRTLNTTDWQEVYRNLRADYDAGKPSRFNRRRPGVSTSGRSADYHYASEAAFFYSMEWARDVDRNDQIVGQGIDRLVENIVQDGFTLEPQTGDSAIDTDLKAWWNEIAYTAETWDIQGELPFDAMEQLTLRQMIVDGDIFHLPEAETGLDEAVEAHRARTPTNTTQNVVHGVLLSPTRRRLEYWFTRDDVSPLASIARVADIDKRPARQWSPLTQSWERAVVHCFNPRRISQTRGFTALAPILNTAEQHDDSQFAELIARKMQACAVLLEESASNAPPGGPVLPGTKTESLDTDTDRTTVELSPGARIRAGRGRTLKGFVPTIPGAQYRPHSLMLLTFIAVNLKMPLQLLLLDPTMTNFSGWRGAMQAARLGFRVFQQRLAERYHEPMYRARVLHKLSQDSVLLAAYKRGVNVFNHRWQPPGFPYIQPEVDAAANAFRVRNLQTSPRRLAAEVGYDDAEVTREIAEDNARKIRLFKATAAAINAEFQDDDPVSWRDVMTLPTPGAVNMSLSQQTDATPSGATEVPTNA